MKILVTGGAGYIGAELSHKLALLEEVEQVIIYDNLSRGNYNLFLGPHMFPDGKVKFVDGEILDSRKLKEILKGIDVVYHLAAKVSTPFADENPHLFEQVNHWGTAELVYACEQTGVSKFIYLSSVAVYGSSVEEVDIGAPLTPRTFYGVSKMRGEEHVQRLASKMPAFIIRCGNVYGYGRCMRFDAVLNRLMMEANFHRRITIQGEGRQHRAVICVARVVEFLTKVLTADISAGTYNLVDRNLAIGDLAEEVQVLFRDLEILYVNRHLKLRDLKIKRDERVMELIGDPPQSLAEELRSFQSAFAFG